MWLVSTDARGSGTRDEFLRESAWEAKISREEESRLCQPARHFVLSMR